MASRSVGTNTLDVSFLSSAPEIILTEESVCVDVSANHLEVALAEDLILTLYQHIYYTYKTPMYMLR